MSDQVASASEKFTLSSMRDASDRETFTDKPASTMPSSASHRMLHVSDVLRQIFGNLAPLDLYSCAQVNKIWSGTSLDFLWRGSVYSSHWMTPRSSIMNDIYNESPDRLIRYLQRIQYMTIEWSDGRCVVDYECNRTASEAWPAFLDRLPQHTGARGFPWKTKALVMKNTGGPLSQKPVLASLLHQNLLVVVICTRHSESIDLDSLFPSLELHCPRLRSLIFQSCKHIDPARSGKWLDFLRAMPSITHVCLPSFLHVSQMLAAHILQRPNLQYLELTATPVNTVAIAGAIQMLSQSNEELALSRLRGLDLSLRNCDLTFLGDMLGRCKNLEFLYITSKSEQMPFDIIGTMFSTLSERAQLRRVSIQAQYTNDLDASSLTEWVKHAPLLHQLDLTHPLPNYIRREPKIQRLKFHRGDAARLATALQSIRYLKLDFRANVSTADLLAFSGRNCPHLEILSLGCTVKFCHLAKLLANAPDLDREAAGEVSGSTSYAGQEPAFPSLRSLCLLGFQIEAPKSPAPHQEMAAVAPERSEPRTRIDVDFDSTEGEDLIRHVVAMLAAHMPLVKTFCRARYDWQPRCPFFHLPHRLTKQLGASLGTAVFDRCEFHEMPGLMSTPEFSHWIHALHNSDHERAQFEAAAASWRRRHVKDSPLEIVMRTLEKRYEWHFRSILGQTAKLW